jgi:hypothetical protein
VLLLVLLLMMGSKQKTKSIYAEAFVLVVRLEVVLVGRPVVPTIRM